MTAPEFRSDLEKWHWLEGAPARDAQDVRLRYIARCLWLGALKRPTLFAQLALAIARDGIRYELDTARVGGEDLDHPFAALWRGVDDCDAKSRLFCALCIAAGLPARMVDHWRGGQLVHVNAAVRIGGRWLPAETTLSRARLGEVPADVPKEKETGQWRQT